MQAPEAHVVETWDGTAWKRPDAETRSPEKPAGGIVNTVTCTPVGAATVGVTFIHSGKARSGVSEVLVWEK